MTQTLLLLMLFKELDPRPQALPYDHNELSDRVYERWWEMDFTLSRQDEQFLGSGYANLKLSILLF